MYFFVQNFESVLANELISAEDSSHLISLRPKIGEIINLTDFRGNLLTSEIVFLNKKDATIKIKILQQKFCSSKEYYQTTFHKQKEVLFQATLTKEYMEKMFEILPHSGFQKVVFFESEFSQKTTKDINNHINRLHKILQRAGEQSQSLYLPQIEFVTVEQALEKIKLLKPCVLCCLDNLAKSGSKDEVSDLNIDTNYIIGPEGGWSASELFQFQTLGLRFTSLGRIVYPSWLMSVVI